jgi:hypothetical protein
MNTDTIKTSYVSKTENRQMNHRQTEMQIERRGSSRLPRRRESEQDIDEAWAFKRWRSTSLLKLKGKQKKRKRKREEGSRREGGREEEEEGRKTQSGDGETCRKQSDSSYRQLFSCSGADEERERELKTKKREREAASWPSDLSRPSDGAGRLHEMSTSFYSLFLFLLLCLMFLVSSLQVQIVLTNYKCGPQALNSRSIQPS